MERRRYAAGTGRIALGAVFSALGLLALYLASVTPSGQLGITAAAGIFPAAALISGGGATGWLCFAATGVLAFFLIPDKGCALLYLSFFGLYPLIKHYIEKLKHFFPQWFFKLASCNSVLMVFWSFLRAVLLKQLPAAFDSLWLFWIAGNVSFILYDLGFSRLMSFYLVRIHRVISRK